MESISYIEQLRQVHGNIERSGYAGYSVEQECKECDSGEVVFQRKVREYYKYKCDNCGAVEIRDSY